MELFKAINIFNRCKSANKPAPLAPKSIWHKPLHFIAFGFGSGAIPYAPGTMGTLFAIPFYLILLKPFSLLHYSLFLIIFTLLSCYICGRVSREINVHDHPGICLDEFVGFYVAMLNAPSGWVWLISGFVLFRLFDILKPWPIKYLDQHCPGGIGIVLDDVLAGMYTLFVLQITSKYVSLF